MEQTFTYHNLKAGIVQHKVTEVESCQTEGNIVDIKFKDDKGRRLQILTNQPFHFRAEEDLNPAPPPPVPTRPTLEVEGDTD